MELDEFIKQTLIDIARGVHLANKEITSSKMLGEGSQAYFSIEAFNREKMQGYINFDVAVTIANETGASGGTGIKIAFAHIGADINSTASLETVSRIKFSIMPFTTIA
ncbi:MAG: hypothetical protein M0Q92_13855 [Methanoregula sp.]|jgi:hypothetical protein|nr:hypothetical protein [Methanoregula sp.]